MELDDMTNKQLHQRILELGLPNIPITNTTRNVQIKRIRAALDAQASNSKTRRETVHHVTTVVKNNSSDDAAAKIIAATQQKPVATTTKSSRRATIAAPVPKTFVKPVAAAFTPPRPTVPVIDVSDSSDSESITIADRQALSKIPQPQKRAPSMGKSEIVTTSFNAPAASIPVIDEDTDADDIGSSSSSANNSRTLHLNMRPPIGGIKTNAIHRTTISTNSYVAPPSLLSYSRPSAASYQSVRNRRTFAAATNGDDDDDDADIDELVQKNSPYLSDFTRRLSRIRAEPLISSAEPTTTSHYREYDEYQNRPLTSRTTFSRRLKDEATAVSTSSSDKSVGSTFVALIRSLDRKYRRFMVSIVFITFVVFIYIMWFM